MLVFFFLLGAIVDDRRCRSKMMQSYDLDDNAMPWELSFVMTRQYVQLEGTRGLEQKPLAFKDNLLANGQHR
jgi:hypothetical protein